MKKKDILFAILILLAGLVLGQLYLQHMSDPDQLSQVFERAKVLRVVDGDTIEVDYRGEKKRLRLILVDTPETVHPNKDVEFYGEEASDFSKKSLDGRYVYLEKDVSDTDRYGRLLRYVWLERPSSIKPSREELRSLCFNGILLSEGYGSLASFPPDIKYQEVFQDFERKAREENLGLWAGEDDFKKVEKEKASSSQETGEKIIYIRSKNSQVFHLSTCSSLNSIKEANKIEYQSRSQAIDEGLRPCSICKP